MHITWNETPSEHLAEPERSARLRATNDCWSVVVGSQVRSGTACSIAEARSRAYAEYLALAATTRSK